MLFCTSQLFTVYMCAQYEMQEVALLAVALLHSSIVTQLPGGCGPPRLRRGWQQLLTTPASSYPPLPYLLLLLQN